MYRLRQALMNSCQLSCTLSRMEFELLPSLVSPNPGIKESLHCGNMFSYQQRENTFVFLYMVVDIVQEQRVQAKLSNPYQMHAFYNRHHIVPLALSLPI